MRVKDIVGLMRANEQISVYKTHDGVDYLQWSSFFQCLMEFEHVENLVVNRISTEIFPTPNGDAGEDTVCINLHV